VHKQTNWQDDFAAAQQARLCCASLLAGNITGMIAGQHDAYTLLVFYEAFNGSQLFW